VYGDVLTNLDLGRLVRFHAGRAEGLESGRAESLTMSLYHVPNPAACGLVDLDDRGRVTRFVEKPPPGTEKSNLASAGVYILEPEVLDLIPPGRADFGFDVFPAMLRKGLPILGYRPHPDEYIMDIGDLERYRQANEDFAAGKVRL